MRSTHPTTRTYMPPTEPVEPPKQPRKKPNIKLPKFKFKLTTIIILLLVAFSIFMYAQYNTAREKIANPSPAAVTKQTNDLVEEVGKIIILPEGETPTIATVQKVEELEGQAFFADANNGDKVIVYNAQKKAILYRPSTKQIVNVAPVSVGPQSGTSLQADQ